MCITLKKAVLSDAEALYALQISSFQSLLDRYQDYGTNPGAEKQERTIERLRDPHSDYYFIQCHDKPIGAIRIVHTPSLCQLKQIFILPEHQGNGYAQQAIRLAESLYPHVARWTLDTIKQEDALCHLYEKMGYRRTGKEETIKDGMTLVFYSK